MALALGWLCPQGGFSLGQGGLGWLRLRVGLGSGLASASGRLGLGLGLALGLGILLGWLQPLGWPGLGLGFHWVRKALGWVQSWVGFSLG